MTAPRRFAFAAAAALAGIGFVVLGGWQLERRAWKHELIARVEQRAHADPVAPPGRAEWPQVGAARDEYRRVRITGTFLPDAQTRVQAATELGAGWWLLSPLRRADGTIVIVNRGFVPPPSARAVADPPGEVTIVGLLRISEPGGGFLRRNDAAAGRWTSRDVAAIAAARGLGDVAPYFVDAERAAAADDTAPVGGLTVLAFPDNHLVYAITWFALAAMAGAAAVAAMKAAGPPRRPAISGRS